MKVMFLSSNKGDVAETVFLVFERKPTLTHGLS